MIGTGSQGRFSGPSVLVLLATALFLAGLQSESQGQMLERLTIGLTGVSSSDAGLLMAKEAAFFKEEGLHVEFAFLDGPSGVQALVGGHLPVVAFSGLPLSKAVLAGAAVIAIPELIGRLPHSLVVLPEIARPSDLKGKRL